MRFWVWCRSIDMLCILCGDTFGNNRIIDAACQYTWHEHHICMQIYNIYINGIYALVFDKRIYSVSVNSDTNMNRVSKTRHE